MQQDYWGAKSKISYLKQKELTARFKMELETIRTECRERMETPHDMVEVLENGQEDRKSVVQGKSVDLGGRRIIKKKNKIK